MAYAWSTLTAQEADDKGRYKTFKPGDEVSAGDLGLDDDEFNELVAVGAVREDEYPVPAGSDVSPVEFRREQLRAAASEDFMAVLPFGSVAPVSEPPPGSTAEGIPQFVESSSEAMALTGFDPDAPAEEGKEPEKSEQDKEAEAAAAAQEAPAPKPAAAPANPPQAAPAGSS
jgi:hypothetical protein